MREGLESGPVAGYPGLNVNVTLTDGTYHDVDSNEMAFKIASKEAFKKGRVAGRSRCCGADHDVAGDRSGVVHRRCR